MIERTLDRMLERIRDHQQTLADCAARLQPAANELSDAWTKAHQDIARAESLPADAARAQTERLARAWLRELQQGRLRQSLALSAEWSREQSLAGLPYDLALHLLEEYQRALLPLLTRVYSTDPQLPLAFDALNDWFAAAAALFGAAYLDALRTRATASARLVTLGQLTGGAAHTLNELFTILIGRTQLLIERAADPETRDEVRDAQQAAMVGARIVQRLQAYAQPDHPNSPIAVDVNLLLRDAAELTRFLWRDQAEARGVVMDVVKDFADVPYALARPADLQHAFVALLLNAIEAIHDGGTITLRTERKGNLILVSFIDDGVGIPANVRTRVFEPLYTTKGAPHWGIGLSIAAQIAAEHGGTLAIENATTRGATVTLTLPVAQLVEQKGERQMSTTRTATILVIDNERSVRDLLARLLKLHGHTVVVAEGGAEGLTAFQAGKFDLVFTDLGMPEMSGWDVAREIKKLDPTARVALTTGWPIELNEAELKARGVDRVVRKPFDIPKLLAMINESLMADAL